MNENEFLKFFTPQRIALIKAEKSQVLNTIFQRYFDFFYSCANKYIKQYKLRLDVYELLNQLYLDFPYLNYDSYNDFVKSIYKRSFGYCKNGGYRYLYENNSSIFFTGEKEILSPWIEKDGQEIEIFNFCVSPYGIGHDKREFFYNKKVRSIFRFISPFLTEKQREYFILQLEGYSPSVIAEKRNLTLQAGNSMKNKIKKVLISHYSEIEDFLINKFGFDPSQYLLTA